MAKIAVAAGGNNVYHVTVEEGTSRTYGMFGILRSARAVEKAAEAATADSK